MLRRGKNFCLSKILRIKNNFYYYSHLKNGFNHILLSFVYDLFMIFIPKLNKRIFKILRIHKINKKIMGGIEDAEDY